jgi:multiple sugar transport system substrate-binding protein
MAMGVESAIFSYGGELGDYATYKVQGVTNSKEAVEGLKMYKELYKFTRPAGARRSSSRTTRPSPAASLR